MIYRCFFFLGMLLMAVSCRQEDDGDFVPRSAGGNSYETLRTTVEEDVEVLPTEEYLKVLPELTGADMVSQNVEQYLTEGQNIPFYALEIVPLIDMLKDQGFTNLDHASLWRVEGGLHYFALFKEASYGQKFNDLRLVCFQTGRTGYVESTGWMGGPDLVGMVHAAQYLRQQGISSKNAGAVLFPANNFSSNFLAFNNLSFVGTVFHLTIAGDTYTTCSQEDRLYRGIEQNCGVIEVKARGQLVINPLMEETEEVDFEYTLYFPL